MTELDVFRIPGSRPVIRLKADRQSHDSQWDERFVLGRIPDYDALRDKHCLNFMLFLTSKKKRNIATPGRSRRQRTPSSRTASKKVFAGTTTVVVTSALLRDLRTKLVEKVLAERVAEELWVPAVETMDACSMRERAILYAQETEELEKGQSVLQLLTKAVQSREAMLAELLKIVDLFTITPAKGQILSEAKAILIKIREITIETLEAISMYREKIAALWAGDRRGSRVLVQFKGKNYIFKLKNDLNFLQNSTLATVFDFSEKSDPFLIHPSLMHTSEHETIPITPSLLPRIKACEKVILDELLSSRHISREKKDDFTLRATMTQSTRRSRGHSKGETRSGVQTRDTSLTAVRNLTPSRAGRPESPRQPGPTIRSHNEGYSEVRSADMPSTPVKLAVEDSLKSSEVHRVPSHRKNRSSASTRANVPLKPSQLDFGPVKPQPPAPVPKPKSEKPAVPYTEELELRGLELEEEALGTEIEAFMKTVPEAIRETFWSEASFKEILKSSYSAFLQAVQGGKRLGLMAFSIDTLNTASKRIHLHLISALNSPDLARVFDLSLTHLWSSFGCDDIRIALNYRDIEGKLAADPDIKSLVSERKFKWKNLTNTAEGKRVILMGVNRPEEFESKDCDFFKETLAVKYAAGLQIGQREVQTRTASTGSVSSYIGFSACLKELAAMPESASSPLQSQLHSLHQKLAMTFTFPAFKRGKSLNLYQVLETTREQGLDLEGLERGYMTSAACLSVGLRWSVFATSVFELRREKYNYIRITDVEVNKTTLDGFEIALLPCDDMQFNLVLITQAGGLQADLDPWECTCSLLTQLTSLGKAFPSQSSEIWLPGFQIRRTNSEIAGIVGMELANQQGQVVGCSEALQVGLEAPVHRLGGPVIRPGSGAMVVKEDFILGKG